MNLLDKTGLTYFWSKLKVKLENKQDKLTAGENIKIENNVISSTGGGAGEVDGLLKDTIVGFDSNTTPEGYEVVNNPDQYDLVPIGAGMDFFGMEAPRNWLFADGSEVSRTEYPDLFRIIGTTYGAGDGSTTFNLPDKRERVTITSSDNYSLGETGGEKTHALTQAEIPNYTLYNQAHRHGIGYKATNSNYLPVNSTNIASMRTGSSTYTPAVNGGITDIAPDGYANSSLLNTTNITVTSGGSGQAMNNMQPYLVCNYIIKVKHEAILAEHIVMESLEGSY